MFFTGMPECFAMMADDGQDFTRPLSTNVPSEEAADYSRVIAAAVPAPAPSDSPDMTDVDISPLFQDIVPSGGTTSSRPGTPVPLPSEGEGEGVVRPQAVEDVAAYAGTASSEHGSSTSSLADSAAHDAEPEVRHDVPPSDETLRRSASSDISSNEGETSGDEREEEDVAPPAPLLPPVAPGRIAEAVHISAPGTEKFSFFAKTVDVAVVVPPSLSRNVVTNIISRVWNPTAGKCTVNGTKRKVKFDLIGSDNLNSLKNYRVIIYPLGPNIEQWRSAEDSFLRDIQPINSMAKVIFITVDGDALTFDFLPFMVRLFDKADPNFSFWTWTPSQITGAKRVGIAAACVGGAWFAMNKISNKPNLKKSEKQQKIKNLSKTKSPTSSKHFKKMNAIY